MTAAMTGVPGSVMVRHAIARLRAVPIVKRSVDPVAAGDRWASLADCRTALTLATGVDVDDIDATTGHNISRAAYVRSRDSWLRLIAENGGWTWWIEEQCAAAGARWARRRPQYLVDLPWPAPEPERT